MSPIRLGQLSFVALLAWSLRGSAQGPVKVTIQDEKPMVFEAVLPIDPVKRVDAASQPNLGIRFMVEGKTLQLGYVYTILKIDEQIQAPTQAEVNNQRLPKTAGGKERDGHLSIYNIGQIRITQTVEVVPTKTIGGKQRRRDSALVRYTLENKDSVPHKVALRIGMDVYVVDNDGALFAAPTIPNKVLDGVELKDKTLPDYIQFLQRPDLKNPGFVGHMTFALGSGIEKPSRAILTSLRAGTTNNWDLQVIPAGGDSAMSVYWDSKEIKPKGKREIGYAFGGGIAQSPENDGNVKVDLGGSFEPGKVFTISASVSDPANGQSLTLELPDGMERVEGREIQPVPVGEENSLVLWKARVLRPGTYHLRIHSNNGVTQTKIVTIQATDAK